MHLPPEKLATYRATARERSAQERQRLGLRRERAWAVARRAAELLRREYGVERVVVFGSLVRHELFHPRSDIDLAVWGLDEREHYRAVGRLLALDPAFEFDLVLGTEIPASWLSEIEREGIDL